ncbi:WD repeat-containing protein GTS1 [Impatiens glandulifera]|uniref:WD repeat-containing protein GTS1 n=1 Tax=Impatiens glandulifera TaxID=253017 RepID=UPI001FB11A10|nr:WD repeat-containing protein GTS1 [Impatiens glandulifera]
MESMEMDVEEAVTIPKPDSFKRCGLKSTIQTNFGDDYVFQITSKDDWSLMAVSLSTNYLKLYSPTTGHYLGECKGHTSNVNDISFSDNSNILHSCSSDGSLRSWDTRSFQQVSCLNTGPSQEIFSFSFGGTSGNLVAAGTKSEIFFWDWRTRKQVACLEDSHIDDVTQVHFIPGVDNRLVSASMDGLICNFDTSGNINDEDHLESVINIGTSIARVGFLGEKLWCLTHIETLSVWDWKDGSNVVLFEDARSLASNKWSLDQVDYFVDCHYSKEDDCLWAIGGTNGGTLGYFPVSYGGSGAIGSPEAVLQGGHTGVVRTILPMSGRSASQIDNGSILGWTGGEDGRLCCWLSDKSSDSITSSWISSGLPIKSSKDRRIKRHQPY